VGHELHESGLMNHDVTVKRAQFIDKSLEIRNIFEWAPAEVLLALKTYCSDYYGDMLWDLGLDKASMVYSALDNTVQLTWSSPRWTRTFLLQQVLASGLRSAITEMLGRYGKFCQGLRTSVSQEVRVLFNYISGDLQCTTAWYLKMVRNKSGLDPWTYVPWKLKEALFKKQLVDIPQQDLWKVHYLIYLLGQLQVAKQLVQQDRIDYIQDLIRQSRDLD
jgi:hypothetical protein